MGVPPMNTVRYSAITLPRTCGSAPSCTIALAVVVRVSTAAPVGTSSTASDQKVGAKPSRTSSSPKASADTSIVRILGSAVRRAVPRAPSSEPTASAEVSRPNDPASAWKVAFAMSDSVIWKFRPKVPIMKISRIGTYMRGRVRT